eukprot:scaffold7147_cov130-Isochrysis_galbana.AAC.10
MDSRCPSRKPCDNPKVVPGLSAAKIFSYSVTHAASEMRQSTWGSRQRERWERGRGRRDGVKASWAMLRVPRPHHVRFLDDGIHLAESSIGLGEADRLGRLHRGRPCPQPDLDLDVRALERLTEVLCLRGALAAPADDANRLDALKSGRELGEEVAATLDDLRHTAGWSP